MAWIEPITNRNSGTFYTHTDVNRVGNNVSYLKGYIDGLSATIQAYIASLGVADDELYDVDYTPATVSPKTDWAAGGDPRAAQMVQYLSDLTAIRGMLAVPSGTPAVPSGMDYFTHAKANDIETILLTVNGLIEAMETKLKTYADRAAVAWYYSGDIYGGDI